MHWPEPTVDKRIKTPLPPEVATQRREQFYADVATGALSIAEAARTMRKISRLTQPEFAKHRRISVQALRQIEAGTGNPTVETLNKIADIFGLEVGFVAKGTARGGG